MENTDLSFYELEKYRHYGNDLQLQYSVYAKKISASIPDLSLKIYKPCIKELDYILKQTEDSASFLLYTSENKTKIEKDIYKMMDELKLEQVRLAKLHYLYQYWMKQIILLRTETESASQQALSLVNSDTCSQQIRSTLLLRNESLQTTLFSMIQTLECLKILDVNLTVMMEQIELLIKVTFPAYLQQVQQIDKLLQSKNLSKESNWKNQIETISQNASESLKQLDMLKGLVERAIIKENQL